MNSEILHPGLLHAESQMEAESIAGFRHNHAASAGVSWGAVLGGAAVAAALSMILLALGAGFGLSAVSPWSNVGMSASAVGWMAIIWLVATEVIASSMGGYLAGRLRTRWQAIHSDEVHFRDTANGFLVWAVMVVATFVLLAGAAASMTGAARTETASNSAAQSSLDPQSYYVSRMFRAEHLMADIGSARRAEAGQIFNRVLLQDQANAASDSAYLAQLVGTATGLSPEDAQRRVSDTLTDAKLAADAARKASAHVLLWTFLALLTGAFCASYAATVGGRQRDHVQAAV